MKQVYITPQIIEETITLEDVMGVSQLSGSTDWGLEKDIWDIFA